MVGKEKEKESFIFGGPKCAEFNIQKDRYSAIIRKCEDQSLHDQLVVANLGERFEFLLKDHLTRAALRKEMDTMSFADSKKASLLLLILHLGYRMRGKVVEKLVEKLVDTVDKVVDKEVDNKSHKDVQAVCTKYFGPLKHVMTTERAQMIRHTGHKPTAPPLMDLSVAVWAKATYEGVLYTVDGDFIAGAPGVLAVGTDCTMMDGNGTTHGNQDNAKTGLTFGGTRSLSCDSATGPTWCSMTLGAWTDYNANVTAPSWPCP